MYVICLHSSTNALCISKRESDFRSSRVSTSYGASRFTIHLLYCESTVWFLLHSFHFDDVFAAIAPPFLFVVGHIVIFVIARRHIVIKSIVKGRVSIVVRH
jgi:hypothetical protein